MRIALTTVSDVHGKILRCSTEGEEFSEIIHEFLRDTGATRLAFAGRTALGRGGVVLHRREGSLVKITGHKLEGVSDDLEIEYEWFSAEAIETALRRFLSGYPVRIGCPLGSVELRWNPLAPEVFGEGEDSAITEQSH